MSSPDQVITDLYRHILRRDPAEKELASWVSVMRSGETFEAIFYKFIRSPEYQTRQRVECKFPAGNFHSPVVDPSTVKRYVDWSASQRIRAIEVPLEPMQAFFEKHLAFFRNTRFAETKSPDARYYLDGAPFPYGDALILRGMIAEHNPKRIIEIGSGFSTAVMLDAAQDLGMRPRIICIEPYPARLQSLMRPDDISIVELAERDLQSVPLGTFEILEAGDILFIDSTHVLKTGSDVHYQLFHILPILKPGVIVHVHDVHYPFEYPPKWIYEDNYSWNEAYALRAFLMYNSHFRITFWNSYFRTACENWLRENFPQIISRNSGGSIWLAVG
jgi:predicted O-methyltransferase YrrM